MEYVFPRGRMIKVAFILQSLLPFVEDTLWMNMFSRFLGMSMHTAMWASVTDYGIVFNQGCRCRGQDFGSGFKGHLALPGSGPKLFQNEAFYINRFNEKEPRQQNWNYKQNLLPVSSFARMMWNSEILEHAAVDLFKQSWKHATLHTRRVFRHSLFCF